MRNRLPASRTIVHVVLTGPVPPRAGWTSSSAASRCKDDPGRDVDLAVEADTAAMQRWLLALMPFRELLFSGCARLLGPTRLTRAFPTWFDTSFFKQGCGRGSSAARANW